VHLVLDDITGAKTLMREIDDILRRRPDLGTLVGQAQELRIQLAAERSPSTRGASALTAAELRLLPLLATHLSGPDIAADLFLSPHTIKSHRMLDEQPTRSLPRPCARSVLLGSQLPS
jgi:LuxR family transcriptional regulator, maltose regulon positive regulatory protein